MRMFNLFGAAAAVVLMCGAAPAEAQFGGLGRIGERLGVGNVLGGRAPITTGLQDARFAAPDRDGFTPREPVRSLMTLQRTPNGGFVLQPGYYELHAQSYCLHAGTHGPGGGDGYLYGPLKGPAEDAITTILRNSVNRPEIAQSSIQTLIWAILARAKFEDLSAEHKAVAARLLTPRQLASLNRNALDVLTGPLLERTLGGMPAPLRAIAQAEAQLRQMLTAPGTSFADMERVAVLAGMAPMGAGSQDVPSGRWSLHPDGYYIRYLPQGYSHTLVQIHVLPGSPAVGREYDPATHVAVPGNTSRQRLAQSGRAYASH